MNEFYVYASSTVSKKHPENVFDSFTVSLPHSIVLEGGNWRVGLCDVTYADKKKTTFPDMFLCMDIISSNFDSTTSLPILRFLHGETSPVKKNFSNVYYCRLKSNRLDTFRMYLNTVDKKSPSVKDTTLFCTLHFKRNG